MNSETAAHTPGPWRANGIHEQSPEPSAQTRAGAVSDDDGRVVAYLPADGAEGIQDRETLANARLIAAAPALLEACKGLLNAFPPPSIRSRDGFSRNLAHAAARSAIAKATKE